MSQCHWITEGIRCKAETQYNICPRCLPFELRYYNTYKKSEELAISNLTKYYNAGTHSELDRVLIELTTILIVREEFVKQLHTPIESTDRYNPTALFRALCNYMDRLHDIWEYNPYSDATIDQVSSLQKILLRISNDPFIELDSGAINNINLSIATHDNWYKLQALCEFSNNDMLCLYKYSKELHKHLDKCLESIISLTHGGKVISAVNNKLVTSPPRINAINSIWNQIMRFTNQSEAIAWYKWVVLFTKSKTEYTLDSYIELIDNKCTIIVRHEHNRLAVYWRVSHWDMKVL